MITASFSPGRHSNFSTGGNVVGSEEFLGSSEFPGEGAVRQAVSAGRSWVEAMSYSVEERLGPFGLEWQREQEEREGVY